MFCNVVVDGFSLKPDRSCLETSEGLGGELSPTQGNLADQLKASDLTILIPAETIESRTDFAGHMWHSLCNDQTCPLFWGWVASLMRRNPCLGFVILFCFGTTFRIIPSADWNVAYLGTCIQNFTCDLLTQRVISHFRVTSTSDHPVSDSAAAPAPPTHYMGFDFRKHSYRRTSPLWSLQFRFLTLLTCLESFGPRMKKNIFRLQFHMRLGKDFLRLQLVLLREIITFTHCPVFLYLRSWKWIRHVALCSLSLEQNVWPWDIRPKVFAMSSCTVFFKDTTVMISCNFRKDGKTNSLWRLI